MGNSQYTIFVSLLWLTLKDAQEEQACFFIRPNSSAQQFIITSLLKLLPTELILKFFPWNLKSSFAWSYLTSLALSLIICLQEHFVLISPVSSSSTTILTAPPLYYTYSSQPPSSLPGQIQPLCYSLTQVLPHQIPYRSILTLTGYIKYFNC